MSLSGADPDQLDGLASDLRQFAEQLQGAHGTVSSRVRNTSWRGPAADRFRQGWESGLSSKLSAAATSLAAASDQLRREADQQRVASGEAAHATSGLRTDGVTHEVGGLLGIVRHEAQAVDHAVGAVAAVAGAAVHTAGRDLRDFGEMEREGFSEVVSSEGFSEAMGGLRAVQTVASVAALIPIPIVQEVALTVAGVSGVLILAGDVAQMANTGKWEPTKLAVDGFSAATSLVGAGIARQAVTAAHAASDSMAVGQVVGAAKNLEPTAYTVLTTDLGKLPELFASSTPLEQVHAALSTASDVAGVVDTSDSVGHDLVQHHYTQAAEDSVEYIPLAMDAKGVPGSEFVELGRQEGLFISGGLSSVENGGGLVQGGLERLDQ